MVVMIKLDMSYLAFFLGANEGREMEKKSWGVGGGMNRKRRREALEQQYKDIYSGI